MEVKRARAKLLALFLMGRIEDIFTEAYHEINHEEGNTEKVAFNIEINPATMLGSFVGSTASEILLGGNKNKKGLIDENNAASISGNYYSQAQNIINNLKIIFTPLGVIYVVRHQSKEITIETIETQEMNREMYAQWQAKNAEFFKNLLLHKMYSEIQIAERQFVKHMIEKQLELQNSMSKKASVEEDLTLYEEMEYIARIHDFYNSGTEASEKLAKLFVDSLDMKSHHITLSLDRPFEKYSSLGDVLGFIGLGGGGKDIRSLQGRYLSPAYLSNRVKVGFLPDRVIFTVDNKMISSLLAIDMDEHAFQLFQKQDGNYFEALFDREVRKGRDRMEGKIPGNFKKEASSENIFERNDIHPMIYFKALRKKYGKRWIDWDINAFVKIIEGDFGVANGIKDIPLNKVMSISVINKSTIPFVSKHAFEKIVRSFVGKSVDFLKRETDDLSFYDLAFGMDMIERMTIGDDVYDNFGEEVYYHIVDILVGKGCMVFVPTHIKQTPKSPKFYQFLNEDLFERYNEKSLYGATKEQKESITNTNNMIFKTALNALSGGKIPAELPEQVKRLVQKQVENNEEINAYLKYENKIFLEQMKHYGLEG